MPRRRDGLDTGSEMYVESMGSILSRWFTSYEDARESLEAEGGFLLPYRHQFYVTSSEGVRELGLDPEDPDWKHIGFDWVRPADRKAWERLWERRQLAM